jgi:phosphohistidine swiveling domain-containing protein
MATLHELVHLSSPLVFAELFTLCEGKADVPWSNEKGPSEVGCVAYRDKELVYFCYNQKVIDWKMEQSSKFDEALLIETSLKHFQKIKDVILNEKTLTREELKTFIPLVTMFWRWFDGVWWRIEHAEKNKCNLENLMKSRKETEFFVPGLRSVIRKSFSAIVPVEYGNYIDVIKLNEILDEKLPEITEVEQRMSSFTVVQGELFKNLEDAQKVFDFTIQKDDTVNHSGEFTGQCAFPGRVQGRVKIVNSVGDMHKFSAGDIIVSSTTTPDFLPIMKISSAIISEHGGVICHAAITSRELKIPCVVGVKKATKHLKDGDLVEVDAEKGLVRLVK